MSKTKTIKDPEVLKLFSDIIKEQRTLEKAILHFKGDNMKAPEWFTEWTTSFEKKNDERWEQNNKRWEQNNKRWEQQLEFNKTHNHK